MTEKSKNHWFKLIERLGGWPALVVISTLLIVGAVTLALALAQHWS